MLFSIVIPMYNAEESIGNCIQSVLHQKEKDFEVIIVNDGSNDKSKIIVEEYMKIDNRIRLINQKNSGSFHARSNAINQAKGKYVVFLDSDDTLKPNALSILKKEIDSSDIDIIIYRAESINEYGNVKEFPPLFQNGTLFTRNKDVLYRAILKGAKGINVMWIKAIKLDLFEQCNFQNAPKITVSDDLLYSLEPITKAKTIKYINDILYEYRYNSKSLMRNFQPNAYEGIKYVYLELLNYIKNRWGMNNKQDLILYYLKYLSSISNYIFYSKSTINNKNDYINTLTSIQSDSLFNEIFKKGFKELKFRYKIPLFLLRRNLFSLLYILKCIISRIRKITNK